MSRNIGEMWKVTEGSKTFWYVKFPNGIMSFTRKNVAMKWLEQLKKDYDIK